MTEEDSRLSFCFSSFFKCTILDSSQINPKFDFTPYVFFRKLAAKFFFQATDR